MTSDKANGVTATGEIHYTLKFNYPLDSAGLSLKDIQVQNGTATQLVRQDDATYSLTVIPQTGVNNGELVVTVGANGANSITDVSRKLKLETPQVSEVQAFDTAAPLLTIHSNQTGSALLAAGDVSYLFSFNEAVRGFSPESIQVSGATQGAFTRVDASTYSLSVHLQDGVQAGSAQISVNTNAVPDLFGNVRAGVISTPVLRYDSQAPSVVSVTSNQSNLAAGQSAQLVFHLSEPVRSLQLSDINLPADTLSDLKPTNASHSAWQVSYTPKTNVPSLTVRLNTSVKDLAGNALQASSGDGFNLSVDTTAPTVLISSNQSGQIAAGNVLYSFSFSKDIGESFTPADVSVLGGVRLDNTFTMVDATHYTLLVAPGSNSSGRIDVSVAAGQVQDFTGNRNAQVTSLSQNFDTRAPSVSVSASQSNLADGMISVLTFAFNKSIYNFLSSWVSVSDGTVLTPMPTADPKVWTATYAPPAGKPMQSVSVLVDADKFHDAGNIGLNTSVSTGVNLTVDTQAPLLTEMSVQSLVSNRSAISSGTSTVNTGDVIRIVMKASSALQHTGNGVPVLSAAIGEKVVDFVFNAAHSQDEFLVFDHTVLATDAGLVRLAGATLDLKSLIIKDSSGNQLVPALPTASGGALVSAWDDAPALQLVNASWSWREGDGPQKITHGNLNLQDIDSQHLVSAQVQLTDGYQSSDVLALPAGTPGIGNITASYSAGTLQLNSPQGSANLDQWVSALQAVTFNNQDSAPGNKRRLTYTVNDGSTSSQAQALDIAVTDVNQAPVLSLNPASLQYAERATVSIDSGMALADSDSSGLKNATFSLLNLLDSNSEQLAFTPNPITMGGIMAVSTSATTLVLGLPAGATATLDQWQAALRDVSYTNLSHKPVVLQDRVVQIALDDGANNNATTIANRVIHLNAVNEAPSLSVASTASPLSYVEADAALAIAPTLMVDDFDNTTLSSAVVQFDSGYQAEGDVLSLAPGTAGIGDIATQWDASTGRLTLTATQASLSEWQTAWRAVSYRYTSDAPTAGNKTLSLSASDGLLSSTPLTQIIHITPVNDVPVISTGTLTTILEDAPRVLRPHDLGSYNDVDGATAWAQTHFSAIQLSALATRGYFEQLITLNGQTQWQPLALFQAVSYAQIAAGQLRYVPSLGDNYLAPNLPSFEFQALDDQGGYSLPYNVSLDITPVPNVSAVVITGLRAGSTAVSALKVGDVLRVTLSTDQSVQLAGTTSREAYVDLQLSSGVVQAKLNPTASSALSLVFDYTVLDNDLQSSAGVNLVTSATLHLETRQITGDDGAQSVALSLPAANANTLTVDTQQPFIDSVNLDAYQSNGSAITAPGVVESDGLMRLHLHVSETVQSDLTAGSPEVSALVGGTRVVFSHNANLSNSRDLVFDHIIVPSDVGLADLSGGVNLKFKYSHIADAAGNVLSADLSALTLTTPSLQAFNDPPSLIWTGTPLAWQEGDGARLVTTSDKFSVSDADSGAQGLRSAVVSFTSGFQTGADVLSFTNDGTTMGDITASWSNATQRLQLQSSSGASAAQWTAALAAVSYNNTSAAPGQTQRVLSYTISDGVNDSPAQTLPINVTPVNTAPSLQMSAAALPYNERSGSVLMDTSVVVNDLDSRVAQVVLGLRRVEDVGQEMLQFSSTSNITGRANSDSSVWTLTSSSATLSEWTAALRSVSYINSSHNPSNITRHIDITLTDAEAGINGAVVTTMHARSIDLVSINDAPTISGVGSALNYTERDPAAEIVPNLTVNDLDSAKLSSAQITFANNTYQANADVLALPNSGAPSIGGIVGIWSSSTGVLNLSGPLATLAQWQTALRAITYSNSSDSPATTAREITLSVNDGNDNNAQGNVLTQTVNVTAVNNAPSISSALNGGVSIGGTIEGDAERVLSPSDFGTYSDLDGSSVFTSLKITSLPAASAGVLQTDISGTWVGVSAGDVFSYNQINQSHLRYVPASGTNHRNASPSFAYQVSDGQGSSAGDYSQSYTASLDITPVPNVSAVVITGLRGGSTPVNALKAGDVLRVSLRLDQAVTLGVDASAEAYVAVQLASGVAPVHARLNASASTPSDPNNPALVFDYTVLSNDDSSSVALSANAQLAVGARTFIGNDGAQNLLVSLPSSSNSLSVDTLAPSLSISSNLASTTPISTAITYTFTLSQIPANGTWDVGDIVASYTSTGSSTVRPLSLVGATLTPDLNVATNHQYTLSITPPANTTGSLSVSVAAGVFTDLAGNDNTAALTVSNVFDTQGPTVSSVVLTPADSAGNASSIYLGPGGKILVDVNFNEAVTLSAGSPYYMLNIGGALLKANYDAVNSSSTQLRFVHTIAYGEYDTAGGVDAELIAALHLNGASLVDALGNPVMSNGDAVNTPNPPTNAIDITATVGTSSAETFDLYNTGLLSLQGNGGLDVFKYHAATGLTDTIRGFAVGSLSALNSNAGTIDLSEVLPTSVTTSNYSDYLKMIQITSGASNYAELQVFVNGDATSGSSSPNIKVDLLGVTPSSGTSYSDLLHTLLVTNHQIVL